MWRYLIGDTIQFTSLLPYKIKVSGRLKHYINAFGEELIIDNAEKALEVACNKTGAIIKEYTAAPIYFSGNSTGAHEWLIEFEKETFELSSFITELDNALKDTNSDYEAKKAGNIALGLPKVKSMPANTFYEWLKFKSKLGGQHKVPRLSNDRTYVQEILELFKEKYQE